MAGSLRESRGIDMNRQYDQRQRRSQSGLLRTVALVVLFTGMFVQITMLARLSGQLKRAAKLEDEITVLTQTVENLEREINNYYNLPEIGQLALKMGMIVPEPEQIRKISVPGLESEYTSAQAGEAGEKVTD